MPWLAREVIPEDSGVGVLWRSLTFLLLERQLHLPTSLEILWTCARGRAIAAFPIFRLWQCQAPRILHQPHQPQRNIINHNQCQQRLYCVPGSTAETYALSHLIPTTLLSIPLYRWGD